MAKKEKEFKEQMFGEKVGPILRELELAILENQEMYPDSYPGYSRPDLKAAIVIFTHVAGQFIWEYENRLGMEPDLHKRFGNELRTMIFNYCDIATEKQ